MGFSLPIEDSIIQFTIVVGAALVVQLLFERTRLPALIGLLVLGMLIGPGGAAILPEDGVIELLGGVGLLFIMFVAGLEIDLDTVNEHRRESVGFGLLAFTLTLGPAVAVGLLIGLGWGGALLLGAALSSHTLVGYPVLERLGLVHRRPMVAAIGGTLLTDTLSLVLLAVVLQVAGGEAEGAGELGWYVPLVLLAALAAAALWGVPKLARRVLDADRTTRAERALFVLAVLLTLSALAEIIGTEDILGAFLAGVCLNRPLRRRHDLHDHLEFAGRLLFIPFFFIETGMRLKLDALASSAEIWVMAALLLAVVAVGKAAAAWSTGPLFGYGRLDRVAMGGLALPQAAATLAVVTAGLEVDLIGIEVVDAVIIVIFLTCLAGPLLTDAAGRRMNPQGVSSQKPGRRSS